MSSEETVMMTARGSTFRNLGAKIETKNLDLVRSSHGRWHTAGFDKCLQEIGARLILAL